MEKVSLILTTYNRSKFLITALNSINNQSHKDYEAIIIDDGSTDNTQQIINEFISLSKNNKFKYIRQAHLGRNQSLVNAHKITSGQYIGWLDSDDCLHPGCLQNTVNYLDTNKNVGLVYTNYYDLDFKGEIIGEGRRCNIPYSKEKLLEYFMVFHFRLFKGSLFEKMGGIDCELETCMDYDLALKMSEITDIHKIPEFLYYYRVFTYDSISRNKQQQQKYDFFTAMQKAKMRRSI